MKPLVSVIIPVYNVAPYLNEALDSVVQQTYRHLEILIIDDGSTDGSGPICDEYADDPRVKVTHQDNRGLSHARNAGLDRMSGEFVCFLDSDDAYEAAFVEKLVEAITREPSDISVCQYTVFKTNGKMLHRAGRNRRIGSLAPLLKEGKYGRAEALRALVDGKLNTMVWNKLYRKSLWNGIRFPDAHNYEDIDTVLRVLDLCSSIFMIDLPLYLYRERPESITHTHTKKNSGDWTLACARLEQYVEEHIPEIFSEAQLHRARLLRLNGMMNRFVNHTGSRTDRREMKKEIIEAAKEIEHWELKSAAAYIMILFCPWLLKISYSVYLLIRLLLWTVAGM